MSDTTPLNWKLKGIYYLTQISGLIVLAIVGGAIYLYRDYFLFLLNPGAVVLLIAFLFLFHAILFALRELTEKKVFFVVSRYVWVFFFLSIVYVTGGVHSPFLFLLIFPLIVSAIDLDEHATRIIGILLTVLFGALIALDPISLADPSAIVKHALRTALFGVICYYMYSIVKETLRQKYEKEETKRRFSELIELDKVKTDFLTVAQHQLRTPLSGLRWGLENLLSDTSIKAESLLILSDSRKKAEDAVDIVNEMLQTVEMKAASFSPKKKSIELGTLIASAVEELKYLASRKGVTVSFSRRDSIKVHADHKLLSAAMLNIIDNAIRYSPSGRVDITLQKESRGVEVKISDSGIGIHPDDLPYLFERFYRGKNAILLDPNESGVGLYIAKRIIEKHGGTISVDSILGKGTTVRVALL
jgi:signal transduction histidine kinase